MRRTEVFDEQVKQSLNRKAEEIEISEVLFQKIKAQVIQKEEENKMGGFFKNRKMKKMIMVGAASLLSITCIAAPIILPALNSWESHGRTSFESFPTLAQVQKEVDYTPKYIDELPGGFVFKRASTENIEGKDADENTVVKAKGISFFYEPIEGSKGRILSLDTKQLAEEWMNSGEAEEIGLDDLKVYYEARTMKFVPVDYELTEQDKQDQEAGKIDISYGTDTIQVINTQAITWYEEGITYTLLDMGYELDKEQLLEMVEAVYAVE
ncbi:hypothetical protein CS063_10315 [Sporanaerobium hydrogeniformans]|uniref:Uncharacterized protein n=1 Tax=Sporanaerobium hydrogeniformans TaxID=3072179 RepID=A0AC61DBR2_9FIRM|nr:hypothetical protein [Sporanaerobium hydrogeniformans]PHV70473.1 hypothetical protein CS063_10315 [Sporanaerobium hydrogeniformans]